MPDEASITTTIKVCVCGHHMKAHVFGRSASGFCLACDNCEGYKEENDG